ncbi:MAG: carboxypeptidase M32 [Rubricoccaceae bacterium]
MSAADALRERLATITDLGHAAAVLEWDLETYMPPGGAAARAAQIATLRRLAHEHLVADETARALEAAEAALGRTPDADDPAAALVRVARRDLRRAGALPARLVAEQAEASGLARGAWQAAREAGDFARFAPHLERLVALATEQADRLAPVLAEERGPDYAPADPRYDALLDQYEPGATTERVAAAFDDLRAALVPLVAAIAAQPAPDDAFLHRAFPEEAQWAFGLDVARAFGYNLAHGRQDRSAHPFTTAFGRTDVRVTTRLDEHFFPTAFFGTVHEVGHALYEQGFDASLDRTPLADGTSLGIHESQSRLWENLVARSPAFWRRWYPEAQRRFPHALADVPEAAFVAAVNRVAPSLIRVEADELTYHLHVLLRFSLERRLLGGTLDVADLPSAWNEGLRDLLGLTPPSDAEGCLQDIHWALGAFGYFPTYTLGTLMSAQLWEAAARDLGPLEPRLEAGDYAALLAWLREHVHRHGRVRSAGEILRRTTGRDLDARPWLAYVHAKYGRLYGLRLPAPGAQSAPGA